jgi:hypothetical protein
MATYPKVLKPWRSFPNFNGIMSVRAHVRLSGARSSYGESGIVAGTAKHVGTIPAGSFVLPGFCHVITLFNGTTPTVELGSQLDPDAFATSALIAPATAGLKQNLIGALTGFLTDTTEVFLLLTATNTTAGDVDIVLPFYAQKD